MSISDIFSKEDIEEHLKSYNKVKSFKRIKRGSHIKYFTHIEGNMYKYMMGGVLINKYDNYIVLTANNKTWSVQKKGSVFYVMVKLDENKFQRKIKKNNKILESLGLDQINIIEEDNNDIFSSLRKPKKISKTRVKEIKEKFNIKNWLYSNYRTLMTSTYIRYIDLNGTKMSERVIITDIIRYDDGSIKQFVVKDDKAKQVYSWKINPRKYIIFKHPNSKMLALMARLDE